MPAKAAREHVREAIRLVDAAADGADDDAITPSEIAAEIRDALEMADDLPPRVRKYLLEALDAVSDGMPADYTAMALRAALGALAEG